MIALLDQGRKAANKINPQGLRRTIEGARKGDVIGRFAGGGDQGNWRHRHSFIDNRNPKFRFNRLTDFDEVGGLGGDFIVNLLAGPGTVGIDTI